jgi:hypothetical protein
VVADNARADAGVVAARRTVAASGGRPLEDLGSESPPHNQRPLHVVLYRWGLMIFVFGLVISGLIYVFSDDETTDPARLITGAKMYQHNLELMGGKGAVYAAWFNEWLANLWHGRQLAYTIAVIGGVIAAACFLLGLLISSPLPDEPDDRHDG